MSDPKTLKVYAAKADDYAKLVSRNTPDQDLQAFIDAIPRGGRVLDLGCGPGNSAAMMRDAGFIVDASDASPEMVRLARELYGIDARLEPFEDLAAENTYDGIWANFSLLHAPKDQMPAHLTRIFAALKSGGLMHLGLKCGSGEDRDALGRYYAYYEETELLSLLADAGFSHLGTRHDEGKGLSGETAAFMIVTAHA